MLVEDIFKKKYINLTKEFHLGCSVQFCACDIFHFYGFFFTFLLKPSHLSYILSYCNSEIQNL